MTGRSLLTDALLSRVGEVRVYQAPEELGNAAIRYFALAVGDENPLYTDNEYARSYGYGGVIAPPTLVCETNQYSNLQQSDDGYAGHSWNLEVPETVALRGGNEYEFIVPVNPSDVLTVTWKIVDMQEQKTRSGEQMIVVTSEANYVNQHGVLLVRNREALIFKALGTHSDD